MTLRADIERFPQAASNWETVEKAVREAYDAIADTTGQGWRFGLLAEGSIDAEYDKLAEGMTTALSQGATATALMATTLHDVARLFGLTDAEQAKILDHHRIDLQEDA